MSCILLWMPGGPSQFETFSPLEGHASSGETKAIDTNVSGVGSRRICRDWLRSPTSLPCCVR